MKRLLAIAAAALALAAPAHAGAPPVRARAYLIVNASTGEVIASRNAQARIPIASITKLMTVLVALEHVKPTDVVTVRRQAAAVGESTINLRAGERITVRDLIEGALIQSANDAADALAEYVGHGDAATFVAMMNAKAAALGLDETHFARPDGLDAPGHVSSARDVTRLAQIAMHNALIRKIVAERGDTISGNRHLHTWNDLLGVFPGVIGVKTGHTGAAGWCQVAAVRGDGITIYATLLGSPTRAQRNVDLAALLHWGLLQYRVAGVIAKGRTYALVQTGYGRAALPLVAATPVLRSVRIGRPLVSRVVAAGAVALPVRAGERLGVVRVYDGRRLVGERPLVAAHAVARPGLGARIGFYARRTVKHMWGLFS
jgi:D-alanyl-D-alanine carboxypeptidase (penicillin-binding protein 5/6)